MMVADGLDEAIIGVIEGFGLESRACYDQEKVLDILMARDGMTCVEAQEWYEFNILGAYCGENMPVFLLKGGPRLCGGDV